MSVNSRKANLGTGPRALRDFPSGAPTQRKKKGKHNETRGAFLGFVFGSVFQALLLWLAVRVLHSAGAVEWSLNLWHALTLSVAFLVWRSFYSYVFASMDSHNSK